jgi:hypothetical protein
MILIHPGRDKTFKKIHKKYHGIASKEVEWVVRHCRNCSQNRPASVRAPLTPIVANRFFERVQIDLIDFRHRPEPDPAHPLASILAPPEFLAPGVTFIESHSEEARKKEKNINENENIEIVAVEEIKTEDGKNGYRVIWMLLDWNGMLMKSRRIHELVENESGGTEYDSWTELGGFFSWPLTWTSGDKKIGVLFDGAFQSLKEFVEGGGKVAAK